MLLTETPYVDINDGIKYNARMKELIKRNQSNFWKIIAILVWLIFLIVLIILKTNTAICEAWTKTFARWYETSIGFLFKWIPFSLTEIIIIGLFIGAFVFLTQFTICLLHRQYSKGIGKMLSIVLGATIVIGLYQATAEMAYNREHHPVTVYEEKVEKTEFRKINDYFIADLNKVSKEMKFDEEGNLISPYSIREMNDLLDQEFYRLNQEYGNYFTPFTTRAKPMLTSFIYRELHITGVTFMPTTEANINTLNVNALKPITFAHEILHTKGVMKEEDADFIALYLMLTSENPYFRYSGYYFSISSLYYLARLTGVSTDYQEVIDSINISFKKNQNFGYYYWKSHNAFADFGNWVNDIYLKLSGEKEGTSSYNDTPTDVDKEKQEVINFSLYQKLYFKLYYEANPK